MGFEALPAIKAVVAALNADEQLMEAIPGGVHLNLAPQDTSYPFIVLSMTMQVDTYGNGATRVLSMPLLLVKVLCEGTSPAPVAAALNRLDEALSGCQTELDGYYLHGVTREPAGAIMYVETRSDATQILHAGATYRAHLSQS